LIRREGTIKIGDRVLAINGINVNGSTLQDAHNLMRQCRGTTLFLIEYDVAIVGKRNLCRRIHSQPFQVSNLCCCREISHSIRTIIFITFISRHRRLNYQRSSIEKNDNFKHHQAFVNDMLI
jgi:hypothetical protein